MPPRTTFPRLRPRGLALALALAAPLVLAAGSAASADGLARVERIAVPGRDRPIEVVHLGPGDDRLRPAILVMTGLRAGTGGETVGRALRERLVADLVADPALLAHARVLVVGDLPLADAEATAPFDDDRDARHAEDPVRDLDGDGVVRWIRVDEPGPGRGIDATHVEETTEAEDDRPARTILREAADGERATIALRPEGLDADGDGRLAEDGPTTASQLLARGWPAHWPEHTAGAGDRPLADPAMRALADWILAHPEIVLVTGLDVGDSIAATPPTRGAGPTGRVPHGVLEADAASHGALAEAFRTASGLPEGDAARFPAGSFGAWTSGHLGLWTLVHPGWTSPERLGALALPPQGDAEAEAETAKTIADAAKADALAGAWRAWQSVSGVDVVAIAPWQAFEHPSLGPVHVGGPPHAGADGIAPPAAVGGRLAAAFSAGVRSLLEHLPRLDVHEPVVRHVRGDAYEITLRLSNDGTLPTRSAMDVRTRRVTPIVVRPALDPDSILSGQRVARVETIASNDHVDLRWLVLRPSGEPVSFTVRSARFGVRTVSATLPAKESAR